VVVRRAVVRAAAAFAFGLAAGLFLVVFVAIMMASCAIAFEANAQEESYSRLGVTP
jgi:hypothetical protein